VRQLLTLLVAVPLSAQTVSYEVSVPSPAAKLFHVKTEFPARGRDTLYLSLPAWSPGAYEIQNYARYVRHFGARNAAGQTLFWDRFDKDTWRVATGKSDRVTVEFEYLADTVDLSLARISGEFGQFLAHLGRVDVDRCARRDEQLSLPCRRGAAAGDDHALARKRIKHRQARERLHARRPRVRRRARRAHERSS